MTLSRKLGVIIVTYNGQDDILDCLESILAADDVDLEIIVVDNGSTDGTLETLRAWASGETPYAGTQEGPVPLVPVAKPLAINMSETAVEIVPGHRITVLDTGKNTGFAGGVNRGLAYLAKFPVVDRFWILNPDSVVPASTPGAIMRAHPETSWGLMSGRVLYYDDATMIQNDGGTITPMTGVTHNISLYKRHLDTPYSTAKDLDFVIGSSMVASRAFYEKVGPLNEDYFLYYEEVDWALRRGDLALVTCPEAIVYHKAGTSIGSPSLGRAASPFSLFFKHRARLRFVRRFYPMYLPTALAFSCAKAVQLGAKGFFPEAAAILRGSFGLSAPPVVYQKLGDFAIGKAFAPWSRKA